ncbi:MAG: YsnF/AvaK domain-containing protein [Pseudomonadota bacterium]|nr:YsnF/AvaK domain-containing protein [Pseudomonadota bacterium]
MSQQPVREIVRLREEQAVVERRPVDRVATTEDLSNFREGAIEVRETAEEAVVAKTVRVVEEVRIGKQVHEREETIDEMLRRKDVDVERIGGEKNGSVEDERAFASGNSRTGDDKPR